MPSPPRTGGARRSRAAQPPRVGRRRAARGAARPRPRHAGHRRRRAGGPARGRQRAAAVHLVARPGLATVDEPARRRRRRAQPPVAHRRGPALGRPRGIPAVRDGRAAVQDDGSQLVALALARAEVARRPGALARPVRGPGRKAGVLGGLAVERGADLTAIEVSPHRADLVRSTLARAHPARPRPGAHRRGAHRRRPRGRRGRAGGLRQGPRRRALHRARAPCAGGPRRAGGASRPTSPASRRCSARCSRRPWMPVAPGGVVAYATCSPHVAETRFVVSDVVKKRADVEVVDARPLFTDAAGRAARRAG